MSIKKINSLKAETAQRKEQSFNIEPLKAEVKLGNGSTLLTKIKSMIEVFSQLGEDISPKNLEFDHKICEQNVRNNIIGVKEQKPILKEMVDICEIKIIGSIYDMGNRKVEFLN